MNACHAVDLWPTLSLLGLAAFVVWVSLLNVGRWSPKTYYKPERPPNVHPGPPPNQGGGVQKDPAVTRETLRREIRAVIDQDRYERG